MATFVVNSGTNQNRISCGSQPNRPLGEQDCSFDPQRHRDRYGDLGAVAEDSLTDYVADVVEGTQPERGQHQLLVEEMPVGALDVVEAALDMESIVRIGFHIAQVAVMVADVRAAVGAVQVPDQVSREHRPAYQVQRLVPGEHLV
jgi:hypothetical protein